MYCTENSHFYSAIEHLTLKGSSAFVWIYLVGGWQGQEGSENLELVKCGEAGN